MKNTIVTLRQARKIADKYNLVWHKEGGQWIVSGRPAHYSIKSEREALCDYLTRFGQSILSEQEYALICTH